MTQRTVRTEYERGLAIKLIQQRELPFTLSIAKGGKRSAEQNRLQHLWCKEAEEQGQQTAEEYRGECKLHCGVPILRAENERFREAYDRVIKPLPYEQKLLAMQEPLDFPITRLMSVEQKTRYLDAMGKRLAEQHGIQLTDPEGMMA